MGRDFLLPGTIKDGQSITREWEPARREMIAGVELKNVRHVPKNGGVLTELYRTDWKLDGGGVGQVFQSILYPGTVSGWHVHVATTDRLFACMGMLRVVLYDARKSSRTLGMVNEFKVGEHRPGLLVIPPGVWHAVENYTDERALLLNIVDVAYRYEDPDHYRLPIETGEIPYRFTRVGGDALGHGGNRVKKRAGAKKKKSSL